MANKVKEQITLSIAGPNFNASLGGTVESVQVGSNYTEESQVAPAGLPVKLDINSNIADGNLGYLIVRNIIAPVAGASPQDQPYVDVATDSGMVNKIATIQPGKGHYSPPPGGTINIWVQGHGVDVPIVFLAIET